jgi:hypothetical protein
LDFEMLKDTKTKHYEIVGVEVPFDKNISLIHSEWSSQIRLITRKPRVLASSQF